MYVSSYMSHHLTGKVPSRSEFMRQSCKANTVKRDQIHPVRTWGNALQGGRLLCFHHQHTHQQCTMAHCPQNEEEAASSATVEQRRSWGTRRSCLLAVQIITWSVQRNTHKKTPSCVFVLATNLFFRLFQLSFRTTVFLILLFLLSPMKWRSQLLKTIKWLCYESVLFWIALGRTALPRRAARKHYCFLKTQMSWL